MASNRSKKNKRSQSPASASCPIPSKRKRPLTPFVADEVELNSSSRSSLSSFSAVSETSINANGQFFFKDGNFEIAVLMHHHHSNQQRNMPIFQVYRLSTKIQAQAFNTTIPWNLVLFGACPWISSVAILHFEKLPLHNLIAISSFSRCVNNSTNTKNS
ncbi:uncharacterized protein [Montipora capricornis]|uniref:uncharacterized protein isoform X2 n=1 Tax=Montipora capricornis TaxID=246305 RepID=UPI0035F1363B